MILRKCVLFLLLLSTLNFVGCAEKTTDNGYYERANKASQEALEGLDKE